MILNNIAEAKEFLPSVNLTVANERFTDFFRRSQSWLVSRVIGTELESLLETAQREANDSHAELRRLCRRIIAEKALLDAIPEMDMQLTEAGFAVQNNDNFSPASAQRVDRLISKMPERISTDVDQLVSYLLKVSVDDDETKALYPDWRSTKQFNRLTMAFMPLMEQYLSVSGACAYTKWDEFHSALPLLNRSMKAVADYYVSSAEIDSLLARFRDDKVSEIHRRAIEELKVVAVASANGSIGCARNAAARARDIMMESPDDFPSFKNSKAYNSLNVNLDGGKVVNFI